MTAVIERIRPLHDKVLVRRDPMLDRTAGGIYAPEEWGDGVHPYAFQRSRAMNDANTKARYRLTGVVVAVGPGGHTRKGAFVPMQLERGMRVRFLDEGEDVHLDDGHSYVMLHERDCVAEERGEP
jgi:co-chaperonin GroES (HSP10)